MLATIASARGDFLGAERLLRQCLELAPGYAEARFDLANELYRQHRQTEVLPLVDRLLATYPTDSSYMALKAQVLRLHGRNAEATALMRQAVEASPSSAKLRLLYGHLLREVGKQAEAIESYRQSLALQPGMGEAYWSLANLKTVRFTEADLEEMQKQLSITAPLDANRAALQFALGKALEDAGRYEQSFEHYADGNALHRALNFYNPQVVRELVARSKALFVPSFFAARSGWGSERVDPIFILGMPRSGSTLLEQILASHSMVEGTRELPEVPAIARDLIIGATEVDTRVYPGVLGTQREEDVQGFAARYLERTAMFRTLGRPRFIDKLPGNFLHVGLIHLMFPRATIIDSRRHPLGCCFSCFKQLFARELQFTYNQEDLGKYYHDYVGAHGPPGRGPPGARAPRLLRAAGLRSRRGDPSSARALRAAVRGGLPAFLREPPDRQYHQLRTGAPPDQLGCRGPMAPLRTLAGRSEEGTQRPYRSLPEFSGQAGVTRRSAAPSDLA